VVWDACVAANFIVQFLFLTLVIGIPLFTLHTCLGQCLGAGVMDMWHISPIFQVSCIGMRGEHRLKVFENRVLRRVFGPKRGSYRRMEKLA
jgi:hypothetical protein